jgi:hypothetical protein
VPSTGPSKLVIGIVLALSIAPIVAVALFLGGSSTSRFTGASSALLALLIPAPFAGAAWFFARRLERRGRPRHVVYPVAMGLALLAAGAVFLAVDPTAAITLGSSLAWMAPFMLGFSLIGHGASRRIGSDKHCAKCEYPFIDDPDVIRCPECGAGWLGMFGTLTGKRQSSRRAVCVGIALVGVGVGVQIGGAAFPGAWMRLAPTSLLVHQAVHHRGFDNDYWKALATRTLSPEHEHTLALGLLDDRLAGERWSADDETWLDGRVRAGSLPPALVDRYFAEMVGVREARLVPVDEDAGGVLLQVEAPNRANIRNTQVTAVVIEGWWVDGRFQPEPDAGHVRSNYALDADRSLSGSVNAIRLYVPRAAKPVSVTFAGWIAIGPFPTMTWQASWSIPPGTPGATPTVAGATSWLRRFEVTTTVGSAPVPAPLPLPVSVPVPVPVPTK